MKNYRLENVVTKHKMQTKCTQKAQRALTQPYSPKQPKEKRLCQREIMDDH